MTHLTDVNTSDIEDAVRLGCHCMCNVFDADDGDVPYFRVVARPDAFLGIPLIEHVSGRHLNALLNAVDVVEVAIDEEAIDKHARAAFLSYSGPLPLSLGRQDGDCQAGSFCSARFLTVTVVGVSTANSRLKTLSTVARPCSEDFTKPCCLRTRTTCSS